MRKGYTFVVVIEVQHKRTCPSGCSVFIESSAISLVGSRDILLKVGSYNDDDGSTRRIVIVTEEMTRLMRKWMFQIGVKRRVFILNSSITQLAPKLLLLFMAKRTAKLLGFLWSWMLMGMILTCFHVVSKLSSWWRGCRCSLVFFSKFKPYNHYGS